MLFTLHHRASIAIFTASFSLLFQCPHQNYASFCSIEPIPCEHEAEQKTGQQTRQEAGHEFSSNHTPHDFRRTSTGRCGWGYWECPRCSYCSLEESPTCDICGRDRP